MPSGIWLYSYLALWALLLAVSFLLVAVLRHMREVYSYWVKNDPEWGLPLGALAPALLAEDIDGRPVSLGASRGKKTILIFLSRGCHSCRRALAQVPSLRAIEGVELILVVSAKELETRLFLAEADRDVNFPEVLALADSNRRLTHTYRVAAVPYAVVVDEDARIAGKRTGWSPGEIESLMRQAEALRQPPQAGDEGRELQEIQAQVECAPAEPAAA
jgi:methylamine dehydrogenase accessory protein MauD